MQQVGCYSGEEKLEISSAVVLLYILKRRPPRCLPPYQRATSTRQFSTFISRITSSMHLPEPDSPPSFFTSVPLESRTAQLRWLAFFNLYCFERSPVSSFGSSPDEKGVPQARKRLCFSRTGVPETVSFRVRAVPIKKPPVRVLRYLLNAEIYQQKLQRQDCFNTTRCSAQASSSH